MNTLVATGRRAFLSNLSIKAHQKYISNYEHEEEPSQTDPDPTPPPPPSSKQNASSFWSIIKLVTVSFTSIVLGYGMAYIGSDKVKLWGNPAVEPVAQEIEPWRKNN